jgi:KRAB domain-containing zinc finger protein
MSSQTAATETHKGNIATGRTLCPHDVCSKAFSSQNELGTNQHVQGEENHYYYIFSEEAFGLRVKHQRLDTCTLYLCDVCNRTFCNQTYLEEHQRVHMGEPPYSCDGCNKAFVVHEHLTVHQHIHTKKEPQYSCGACKRAFANQKHLMQHHRVQSRERPFLCCMCNNDYKYDCNLKRHLRKHT